MEFLDRGKEYTTKKNKIFASDFVICVIMHLALGYACSSIKNVYLLFRHPHVKQHSRVLDELVNPGFQIA